MRLPVIQVLIAAYFLTVLSACDGDSKSAPEADEVEDDQDLYEAIGRMMAEEPLSIMNEITRLICTCSSYDEGGDLAQCVEEREVPDDELKRGANSVSESAQRMSTPVPAGTADLVECMSTRSDEITSCVRAVIDEIEDGCTEEIRSAYKKCRSEHLEYRQKGYEICLSGESREEVGAWLDELAKGLVAPVSDHDFVEEFWLPAPPQ